MLELHSAGEDALILYLGHETSPVIAARVQAACSAIETALGDDLRDLVPSYASVLIIYDPLRTDHLSVGHRVRTAVSALATTAASAAMTTAAAATVSTTAAATISTTASAATARSFFSGDIHLNISAVKLCPIKIGYTAFGLLFVFHLNKTKSFTPAGFKISNNFY